MILLFILGATLEIYLLVALVRNHVCDDDERRFLPPVPVTSCKL